MDLIYGLGAFLSVQFIKESIKSYAIVTDNLVKIYKDRDSKFLFQAKGKAFFPIVSAKRISEWITSLLLPA
jgi:hypothetical protein